MSSDDVSPSMKALISPMCSPAWKDSTAWTDSSASTDSPDSTDSPASPAWTDSRASTDDDDDVFYRTKLVKTLGVTIPIVLQDTNGPCSLIAICNVLLLRGNAALDPNVPKVSQRHLLYLVANTVLDMNSSEELQDVLPLLPNLAQGINVNLRFQEIDDFDFTHECSVFNLLHIRLYHGWVVDPEDVDTAAAIGSKSYNALTGELIMSESRKSGQSSVPSQQKPKKGDFEEEEQLNRALILSEIQTYSPISTFLSEYDSCSLASSSGSSSSSSGSEGCEDCTSTELCEHEITNIVCGSPTTATPTDGCLTLKNDQPTTELDSENFISKAESCSSYTVINKVASYSAPAFPSSGFQTSEDQLSSKDCCLHILETAYGTETSYDEQADVNEENTEQNAELIKTFLIGTASQLTDYGLLRLTQDVEEGKPCVFFRNNHFSTMIKHDGELYLLVTDRGLAQSDLVWQKLNRVDGDTVFMTECFTEWDTRCYGQNQTTGKKFTPFGGGSRLCPGSALAKVEGQVVETLESLREHIISLM